MTIKPIGLKSENVLTVGEDEPDPWCRTVLDGTPSTPEGPRETLRSTGRRAEHRTFRQFQPLRLLPEQPDLC